MKWVLLIAGAYNVAADTPHTKPVYWMLQTARSRSIVAHSSDIVVPSDIGDSKRIADDVFV